MSSNQAFASVYLTFAPASTRALRVFKRLLNAFRTTSKGDGGVVHGYEYALAVQLVFLKLRDRTQSSKSAFFAKSSSLTL